MPARLRLFPIAISGERFCGCMEIPAVIQQRKHRKLAVSALAVKRVTIRREGVEKIRSGIVGRGANSTIFTGTGPQRNVSASAGHLVAMRLEHFDPGYRSRKILPRLQASSL